MNHVDEIKRRLAIEDVVGSYIELKSAGKNFKALCPFHQEKTPSFTVTPERNSFYCFGCNKGGDAFTFVEEFEGVDFRGALKILADRAGVELKEYTPEDKEKQSEKEYLYDILEDATQCYRKEFKASRAAQAYIEKRGISIASQKSFRIGYAPDAWDFIQTALKGQDAALLEKAGLIKESEKRKGTHYDRFRNRIMFPIADSSGRIIGFSGRTLSKDDKTAKYINSPETAVFKKRDALFGLDKAKLAIRKRTFSILVEGQVDLVLSHDKGFPNTVAASGTALRDAVEGGGGSAFSLLQRLSKNLVIAFDSDKAGKEAAVKNARLALALGMDVKIAELPEGKDPADILLEDPELWKEIIRKSRDAVDFELEEVSKSAKDSKALLKSIESRIFETIAAVPNEAERDLYLGMAALRAGISKGALITDFDAFTAKKKGLARRKQSTEPVKPRQKIENKNTGDIHRLAGLITLIDNSKEAEAIEKVKELKETAAETLGKPPEKIIKSLPPPEREELLIRLERELPKAKDRARAIEEVIRRIAIQKLTHKALEIRSEISKLEASGDKEQIRQKTEDYFSIQQEIDTLKHNHA